MNLIIILFLLAAILIILIFTIALKIKLVFDTNNTYINMTLLWLNLIFKALITFEDTKPSLTLYIFNKNILKMALKQGNKKHEKMNIIQLTEPKEIHVNANYGFRDPFITGITCGAINVASQFINIDSINQTPDFNTLDDYIYLDATAKINLGSTLLNYLKQKKN